MTRRPRAFHPTALDRLEDRVALSQGGLRSVAARVADVSRPLPQPQTQLNLNGEIAGLLRVSTDAPPGSADALTTIRLAGAGQVRPLGLVAATGRLLEGGIAGFHGGTLTLSSRRGTVNLRLEERLPPPRPSGQPVNVYQFTIEGGTGAYQQATGSGVAYLYGRGTGSGNFTGPFRLTLRSDAPLTT
jgi:hypothetical protein